MDDSTAKDISILRLRPLRERKISTREYTRILASVKAIGLIEPLIVFPDGDDYVILDGVQRYKALLEMGVDVVPCIVGKQREAFTGNRMVNRVSPLQEHRMIEKSLEELDENTIASTLGIQNITYRLKTTLFKRLHPDVIAAFDEGKLTRACARELTHVKAARQKEILATMEGYKDFGVPFVKSQVLKTPVALREGRSRKAGPWDKSTQRKSELLKKLTEAEQKHDFYSQLYKQYTIDLLRLAIFARSLLTNLRVRAHMEVHHPAIVATFESVIADTRG